jgi:membrane fusion protein, multidrug efflux system
MIIRKPFYLAATLLFLFSCGSTDEKEQIKEQIKQYKDEVNNLSIKITELENELERLGVKEEQFSIPVSVTKLSLRPFRHYFEVSGNIEAVKEAFVSPEISGQIEDLPVVEGENVKKGQLLAKLNTNIIENSIREVETQLELAVILYEKQKQLWEKNIGSEVQYLQAKNNKEALESKLQTLRSQLEMAFIRSPINGIVDKIFQKKGELAGPGMQMMQVVNLDELFVVSDVSEKYLPAIRKNDTVSLSFPSFPDLDMSVPVNRVGNVVNKSNRTFTVELRIKNINGKLKPNMLARIIFLDFEAKEAIVVPALLVKEDINGKYLYVARDDNGKMFARKVYVTTGMSYGDETMIESGLNPGNWVITEGFSMVKDGTEVNII